MRKKQLLVVLLSLGIVVSGCTPFWLEEGTPFAPKPTVQEERPAFTETKIADKVELPSPVVPIVPKNDTEIQPPTFEPIIVEPDAPVHTIPPIGRPMSMEDHRYYLQQVYVEATDSRLSVTDQKVRYAEAADAYSKTIPTYPWEEVFNLMIPLAKEGRNRTLHLMLENDLVMMERIMLAQLGVRTFAHTKGETRNPLYHFYLFSAGASLLVYSSYLHVALDLEENYRLLDLHFYRSGYSDYYFSKVGSEE